LFVPRPPWLGECRRELALGRDQRVGGRRPRGAHLRIFRPPPSSSSSAFASTRSPVSKPSMDHPWIGARRSAHGRRSPRRGTSGTRVPPPSPVGGGLPPRTEPSCRRSTLGSPPTTRAATVPSTPPPRPRRIPEGVPKFEKSPRRRPVGACQGSKSCSHRSTPVGSSPRRSATIARNARRASPNG